MKANVESHIYHKGTMYYFVSTVRYSIDNNYGADADGNRGVKQYLIEDMDLIVVDKEQNPIVDGDLINSVYDFIISNLEEFLD